jgi:hypothetical protein
VSVNEAKYPSTHSPIHVIKDRPSSSCDIPFQQFEIKDSSVTNQSGYCFSIFFFAHFFLNGRSFLHKQLQLFQVHVVDLP